MKQKIKIMKKTPQPSDEEIQSFMNFDQLLENRKVALSSSRSVAVLRWIVPVLIITGIISWVLLSNNVKHKIPASRLEEQDSTINSIQIPATVSDTAALQKQKENVTTRSAIRERKSTTQHPVSGETQDDNKTVIVKEPAYTQAEPLNGYAELYHYFTSNLIYPQEALRDSIQGIQTISFIINPEGQPEKIEVVESLGEPFEKESRRLIENMPAWKPATLNGKPVPSKVAIPLTFQIKKIKE